MRRNRLVAMLLVLVFACSGMLTLGVGCKDPDNTPSGEGTENGAGNGTPNRFADLTYVAFGDSITFGVDHMKEYEQMEKPYPTLVGELLGLGQVNNQAAMGATFTANELGLVCMTDRITEYHNHADIISVHLGFNDWARTLPLGVPGDDTNDTIYGCLYLISEHLTHAHENAFVFFITPYPTTLIRNDEYTLEDVASAIYEVAAQYGIPVVDMYTEGKFELEMNAQGSDGVHPTQAFFVQYTAPQIAEFISKNYGKS